MADTGKSTAKFTLGFEDQISGSSRKAADSLEHLSGKVESGEQKIRDMSAAMRRLRGSSDEVKAAKDELKTKIDAERNAVSSANLALLKKGTSYDKLTAQAKKLAKQQEELKKKTEAKEAGAAAALTDALAASLRAAGGPADSLKSKIEALAKVAGSGSAGLALVTLAAAGVVAAIVAMTAAVVAGAASITKFVLETANMSRNLQLAREAFAGSATNATALGTQVDALADKLSTPKEELNALAVSLAKARIEGQTLVDTFNAMGQASAAGGTEAAKKIEEIITRGRRSQRTQISPLELLGTGLDFTEVATELAHGMHTSVDAAKKALFEGRVKLGDGAKALRDTVEKRFGAINLRKAISLEGLSNQLKNTFSKLTSGVKLDPILESLARMGKLLDTSSVTGAALRDLITDFAKGVEKAFKAGEPVVRGFTQGLIIGALNIEIAYLKVRKAFRDTFGRENTSSFDATKTALEAGKITALAFAAALGAVAVSALGVGAAIKIQIDALTKPIEWAKSAASYLSQAAPNWARAGMSLVDGLVQGVKAGFTKVEDTVRDLAKRAMKAFKVPLKINSPSKEFRDYGKALPDGAAGGVQSGTPALERAVDNMVPPTPRAPAAGGTGGASAQRGVGAPTFIFHIDARGATPEVAKQIEGAAASIIEKVTRALEQLALGAGTPVQA